MQANTLPGEMHIVTRVLELVEQLKQLAPFPDLPFETPSIEHLSTMLNHAFWASTREEEGRIAKFSLAYYPSQKAPHPLVFTQPMTISPGNLVRLAPTLKLQHRAISVINKGDSLQIWGTSGISPHSINIHVLGPGYIIVRFNFRNVLVYRSGDVVFLENEDYTTLLRFLTLSLRPYSPFKNPTDLAAPLYRIIRSMYSHGHGGTILIVPPKTDAWRNAIASVRYECSPLFKDLREGCERYYSEQKNGNLDLLRDETQLPILDDVGNLTATDGATIINTDLDLIGFGFMIKTGDLLPSLTLTLLEAGVLREEPRTIPLDQVGGARHRSAAEFCAKEHEAVAFVASQDGTLSVFGWAAPPDNTLYVIQHAERYLL